MEYSVLNLAIGLVHKGDKIMHKLIEVNTECYNEKRYGKPWIALIDFSSNAKGDFQFGTWIGQPGYSGILQIHVKPGDIIARGQKDIRKPKNSAPTFYVINDKYEIEEGGMSLATAYKKWRELQANKPAVDLHALIAEKSLLLARLAEIDKILSTNNDTVVDKP